MNKLRSTLVCLWALIVSGCGEFHSGQQTPKVLGLTTDEWQRLDPSELPQIRRAQAKRRAWLKQWQYGETKGSRLLVYIHGGNARLWPDAKPKAYLAQSAVIKKNQCQPLKLTDSYQQQNSDLWLCYVHDYLYIDPSPTQKQFAYGSVILPINNWLKTGVQFCDLNTQGFSRLDRACLWVKLDTSQDPIEAEDFKELAMKSQKVTQLSFVVYETEPEQAAPVKEPQPASVSNNQMVQSINLSHAQQSNNSHE
ncbi:MAG: hypothetical protein VXY77_03775 [Pseudomonadota bacterium]|nr:hypothetical protein [Pseudomonadota bacterium]